MNVDDILKKHDFPDELRQTFKESGLTTFFPPQEQCIEKGLLDGQSVLMSVPTASGKTLMAELAMIRSAIHHSGRCLYIAPLKALASEKYEDFKKKYEPLGIKVGIATGDLDSPSKFLNRYQILIATAEKVDSLIRSRAKWLIDSLSVVILDEIHFINDGSRGPTMEILTARIKHLNPSIQILALSATVRNADDMADWLGAKLVQSQWRPIPLKEGVYHQEKVYFEHDAAKAICEEAHDDLSKLTLDTLRGKGQVLVFVNSRRSAQAASRQVSINVGKTITDDERKQLVEVAKKITGNTADATKLCGKLADVVKHGAAFHHAGLKPKQRKLIEDSFKQNLIKVICSTPTLAAGVNLPARRVIVRDCKRFESGLGSAYIPAAEYKQCAGRAGRPQYDDHGEAILMAKSFSETGVLFERYIDAEPEPVVSKLGNESALRMHVLASIAGGYVHDTKSMFEFISHTFFSYQKANANIIDLVTHIFEFLTEEGFLEKSGFRYFATTFGSCVSRLYIDPLSAIILRDGLRKIEPRKNYSNIGLLNMVHCCPDAPILSLRKSDYEEVEFFAAEHEKEFVFEEADDHIVGDFYTYMATLKTTHMLSQWIEESKEDLLCDTFGVGPGDIYRHVESTEWLLHAAGVFAELFQYKNLTFHLNDLRNRVHYGIKQELIDLAHLKGVGRIRARRLYSKGIKTLEDLKFKSEDELAKIPTIGKALAKDILKQLTRKKFYSKVKT